MLASSAGSLFNLPIVPGVIISPSHTQAIADRLSTSRPRSTTVVYCNTVIERSDLPRRISPDQAGIHKNEVLVDVVEKAALSADATTPNGQTAVRDFDLLRLRA